MLTKELLMDRLKNRACWDEAELKEKPMSEILTIKGGDSFLMKAAKAAVFCLRQNRHLVTDDLYALDKLVEAISYTNDQERTRIPAPKAEPQEQGEVCEACNGQGGWNCDCKSDCQHRGGVVKCPACGGTGRRGGV